MASALAKPGVFNRIFACRTFNVIRHFSKSRYSLNTQVDQPVLTGIWANKTVQYYMSSYEDLVGLTEVRNAQDKVLQAEGKFLEVQVERRNKQLQLSKVQAQIKEINAELDKVQRGEDRYLALLTQEHAVIREENKVLDELAKFDELERTYFAALSSAVRESHEKERARSERTKYWSVTASVIGALLGIFGTSINNYLRMRELRRMMRDQVEEGGQTKELLAKLTEKVANQYSLTKQFIHDLKVVTGSVDGTLGSLSNNSCATEESTQSDPEKTLSMILENEKELQADMKEIKGILSNAREDNIYLVGTDFKDVLSHTEKNIEAKMKLNALYTVTFIYGALALTIPILYGIFKGP